MSLGRSALGVQPLGADAQAASSSPTGSLAATETPDAFASTGSVTVVGSLAASESADTFASTGSVAVTGDLAATEAADTFASTGGSGLNGSLAASETADTFASTGDVSTVGSLAATEATDTFAAISLSAINGDFNASESPDTADIRSVSGGGYYNKKRKITIDGRTYEVKERDLPAFLEVMLREPDKAPVKPTKKVKKVEQVKPAKKVEFFAPKPVEKRVEAVRLALDVAGLAAYFTHLDQIARRIIEEQEEDDLEALLMLA